MSEERLVASWSKSPYTGLGKRRISVEHRIRLVVYDGGDADVLHEIQCPERGVEEWALVEAFEIRPHGLTTISSEQGVVP